MASNFRKFSDRARDGILADDATELQLLVDAGTMVHPQPPAPVSGGGATAGAQTAGAATAAALAAGNAPSGSVTATSSVAATGSVAAMPADGLFYDNWHLYDATGRNLDINVEPVWP